MKLNDDNWVTWSKQTYAILWETGVNYCVHDDYEGTYDDYKAQTIIVQSCTEEYSVQISDLKSACAMWNTLMQVLTERANGRIMSLHHEVKMFKMRVGEKPSAYVLRARKIANTMRSLGGNFDDISLCSMILSGLTEEYEYDRRQQRSACYRDPDVYQLQHVLELSYLEMQSRKTQYPNTPKPFRNQGGGSQPTNKGNQGVPGASGSNHAEVPKDSKGGGAGAGRPAFQQTGRPVIICHHCNEVGHIRPMCPKLQGKQGGEVHSNCVQLDTVVSHPSLPAWLIDSGSTDHISPSNENMVNYVKFDVPQRLIVANGKSEEIVGEGTMQVFLESGSSLYLHNVKHVPSSKKYLLSVGKAYQDGINVNILGIECFITDSDGYNLGHAEHVFPYQWLVDLSLPDKYVSFHSETKFVESCNVQVSHKDVDLWHQRLGHLSPKNLMRMRKGCMVKGMKLPPSDLSKMIGNKGVCSPCLHGKQSVQPFKSTGSTCSRKLEVVHMDLMGPISPETNDEEKYALNVIDEFSEMSATILLKTKADASKEAINLLTTWQTQNESKVKFIRTDNGTEFSGLEKFCRKHGTVHQKTAPYAHQQNGKIERLNRTLQEKARAMLSASGLPPEFWGDALLTANYIRNLSAVSNHDKTPYEMWFGVVPDVGHLRIFGSKCFVMTDKSKREGKFGPVCKEGIFLGYDGYSKNYRVLIDSKVVVHSREYVRFEEKHAEGCFSDMPDLVDMTDDDEDVPTDPELIHSEGNDVANNMPDASLSPLVSNDLVARFDQLTARDVGVAKIQVDLGHHEFKSDNKGPAGSQDIEESGPRSTSGLGPCPGMDATQVASHDSVEEHIPGPQLEPIEFDFQSAGVPYSPAGMFGGRYPERKRNTVVQPEINHSTVSPAFCGYVQVQKDTVIIEPATYIDAINSTESEKWVSAMNDEINSLKALGTWSYVVVDDRQKKKALPVKWVYKVKLSEIGEVERFKARLVAKGFKQIYGVDYTEVYAPVSKHTTLRYLLSKGVDRNMHVHQMDVSTAFLHGDLAEKVFIQQPEGFHVGGPNTVCRLHKALYGLKQAPRAWYVTISSFLKSAGFVISDADPSLFILQRVDGVTVYLLLYVDDILIASQDLKSVEEVKALLASKFAVKDLGEARHFLGMQIEFERESDGTLRSVMLSNEKLVTDILDSFGMTSCKPKATPLDTSWRLQKDDGDPLPKENRYRELVGGILYLANTVRPDLSYAAGLLARFSNSPTTTHLGAGMNVLRYLAGTKGMGLQWEKGSERFVGYVDSDYAGDLDGRKSTSGYAFMSGSAAVSWGSKLQPVVALSTVEAEFVSMCSGVQEALWFTKMLNDFGESPGSIVIYTDNTGALANVKGIPISSRTKHIAVRYHRVRDEVENGAIKPLYVATSENIADFFTKVLPKAPFTKFREMAGLK
jgi:hypothetical protein